MAEVSRSGSRWVAAARTVGHSLGYARALVGGGTAPSPVSCLASARPTVALVHGFMGTPATMSSLAGALANDGRPNLAFSHGPLQIRSLRASAEDLRDDLAELHSLSGGAPLDVVAFSMGGLAALHAVKFLQAHKWVRNLILLGTPVAGTWSSVAGVATMGLLSSSVWQVLPQSGFLRELLDAPLPTGSPRVSQIYADTDLFCPKPARLREVAEHDLHIVEGGHASLLRSPQAHNKVLDVLGT